MTNGEAFFDVPIRNMKKIIILSIILIGKLSLYSEILNIPDEYIIFEKANSGYDLYIKKMPDVGSILLTESQKDTDLKKTNYGLRTLKFHPCNGNEKRILDEKVLQTKYDVFFLVDSTLEPHYKLGEVFHFFFPDKVFYGYKWSRRGEIKISQGIKINLRLFKKKYADYSGEFLDQWITLRLQYQESNYHPNVINNFKKFAEITSGKPIVKTDDHDINKIFEEFIPNNVPVAYDADVVFIIDATMSMKEEMPYFQKKYPVIKKKLLKKIKYLRMALIFYRDYGERFLTKVYDFTDDQNYIDYLIGRIYIDGGDDIPEALYEGIAELANLNFQSSNRIAFLIGDAPAHPKPRGNITRENAVRVLNESKVKLHTICFPFR